MKTLKVNGDLDFFFRNSPGQWTMYEHALSTYSRYSYIPRLQQDCSICAHDRQSKKREREKKFFFSLGLTFLPPSCQLTWIPASSGLHNFFCLLLQLFISSFSCSSIKEQPQERKRKVIGSWLSSFVRRNQPDKENWVVGQKAEKSIYFLYIFLSCV